jgi:multiple sugar transport system substrate-binding protein
MGAIVRRPLVLVVVATLLAACAGTPAAPESVTLRVVMADDWASVPLVGEVIDAFEDDHPGVSVQVQGAPFSQIPDMVRSGVELEQPHDLAHWHAFAAAAAGLAQPLDDLWDEAGLTEQEYVPGAVEDVTWEGGRYGVPLDVNALVLMVNLASFEAADLDVGDVATLEGFERAAEQVVEEGGADYAITVSASSWAAYGWIVANGGGLVDDDGAEVRFTLDDPATAEALAHLAALVATDRAPGPFAPNLAIEAIESFVDGSTAMHASGSWDLPIARRADPSRGEVADIQILPLPQAEPDDPRTVLGGSSLFVPPDAPNRELAFELMLALTEDDVALELAVEEGRLPARQRVYDHPVFASSPDLAAFVEQLPTARVMPLVAYPEVAAAFGEALEDIVAQRESVEEALAEAQQYADQWLAGRSGQR